MSDIIKFPLCSGIGLEDIELEEEFKHTSYTDCEGDLGVSSRGNELAIARLNKDDFLVGTEIMDREALAEFLWVAATFVDSEKRYFPNLDLIGCDY
jgi:hypothetical protein